MAQFGTGSKLGEHMRAGIDATAYRLNGLGILSVIVRDAGSRVPFQGGRTLVYIPAAYVPRLLWAGKPKFTTGQWVTDHFGYGPLVRSSTGATWMGELFYNFGWKGIVIGMFALGAWFSFLQQYFLSATATIPALLAGAVSILTLCTGLESDLLNATNSIVFNVAPILLTHAFVRSFAPAPTRLPAPL
jgi:hypothetical protein